jgi:ribosome-associated protein
MLQDVVIASTPEIRIPRSELTLQFSRSGGPGGQNVNKVESRVQLRWNVLSSAVLSEPVRMRLITNNRRRINADGELLITSSRSRDRLRNIDDCVCRLAELVLAATVVARTRRATRPTVGSRRRRLTEKRERSERKRQRRAPGDSD